jgi:hypothetical protein
MEIKGRISWIGEIQETGKENRVTFEITELEGQYPNSLVLDIYGNEKVDNFFKFNLLDDIVNVEFNSRVFTAYADGRKFNNLSAWKITK